MLLLMTARRTYLIIIILACGGIVLRLLPNLISPIQTFGYDFGFYLYNLRHASWSAWSGYGNFLFPLAHFLHLPSEPFLIISQLILSVSTGLACYYFWSKENKTAAVWSGVLFFLSIAQSQLFLMFLWKNLFGLFLTILALKFVREKRFVWAGLMLILTILTHRTSAVFLILCLVIYLAVNLIERRSYWLLVLGFAGAAGLVAGHPWLINFWHNFSSSNSEVYNGIFFSYKIYIIGSLPILILGAVGVYFDNNKKQNLILITAGLIALLWAILPLPFHYRIIPYFDITAILYAGYFLGRYNGKYKKAVQISALAFISIAQLIFLFTRTPLITKAEISEIKNFQTNNPETLAIALSANDAPWLLGYLNNARIAAPGLFEDRDSEVEWDQFWEGFQQKIFFARYPRPLVIYQRSWQPVQEVLECAPPISENFLNYQCK